METITSRVNPLIKHIRRLISDRDYRRQSGSFVCDGPKLLEEAVSSGVELETVLISDSAAISLPEGINARLVAVDDALLQSVAGVLNPQGVLFTCRMPDTALPGVLEAGCHIVLDGVQDPGNVGTVIRTADAFSISSVLLAGACADPFNPKCVRATMGAVFRQRIIELSRAEAAAALEASGLTLYAADNDPDAVEIDQIDLSHAAVVIGSEGPGVSAQMLALCGKRLRIPMPGKSESLNAAVAASIVMWEMSKKTAGKQ